MGTPKELHQHEVHLSVIDSSEKLHVESFLVANLQPAPMVSGTVVLLLYINLGRGVVTLVHFRVP